MPMPGEVGSGEVIGGYRLERLIGSGSTSQVFLGVQVRVNRMAAIKVLSHALYDNKEVISRMLLEARIVNDIRHPNIIDILDFVETESPPRVALVMEYIEGPSLKAMRDNKLPFATAMPIAFQLVAAVQAAHKAGIIHRDLKPDNLLLTHDPRQDSSRPATLKVVDFGIAKLAGSSGKTATGIMLGTPAYMAPEQVAGRPPASPATDVFAIGEVLYELITGTRAYPSGAIHETVRAKLRGEVPKLELPPVPGDKKLLALITRCLSLKPQDRPTLDEVREILVSASTASGGERPARSEASNRARLEAVNPTASNPDVTAKPVRVASRAEPLRSEQPRTSPGTPIDPLSGFAPAVLSASMVDVGPGSVLTEMIEQPTIDRLKQAAPTATDRAPLKIPPEADTSPTNKVLQALTLESQIPERNPAHDRGRNFADITDLISGTSPSQAPPPAPAPLLEAEETEEVDGELLDELLPPDSGEHESTKRVEDLAATLAHPLISQQDVETRALLESISDVSASSRPELRGSSATRPRVDATTGPTTAPGVSDVRTGTQQSTGPITQEVEPMALETGPVDVSAFRVVVPAQEVHPMSPAEPVVIRGPSQMAAAMAPIQMPVPEIRTPPAPPRMTVSAERPGMQNSAVFAAAYEGERRRTRTMLVVMAGLLVIALGLLIPMLLPLRTRDTAGSAGQGHVVVSSNPPGARVELADTKESLGRTPVDIEVPRDAKVRRLRIWTEGYRAMEIELTDSHPKVWVELEPLR